MAGRAEERRCGAQKSGSRHTHRRLDWYWPAEEPPPERAAADDAVRLLAPFDPVVWDRRRFELLWGWAYRFEAYTPAPQRQLGYYALPLLWRDQVIGWGNLSVAGRAAAAFPLATWPRSRHRDRAFRLRAGGRARAASESFSASCPDHAPTRSSDECCGTRPSSAGPRAPARRAARRAAGWVHRRRS